MIHLMSHTLKPPTAGEGGPIDLPALYDAVQLPREYLTPGFIREHVIPAMFTEFTDGEITSLHPTETDPVVAHFFGSDIYSDGVFGPRIRSLFENGDTPIRHQADAFVRFCADVVVRDIIEGNVRVPELPNVSINTQSQTIHFDNHCVELETKPKMIIDYGPGIQGRFHVEQQIAELGKGGSYQHIAITKGPFINEFLMNYWGERVGRDLLPRVLGGYYVGRENGIAEASSDLITDFSKAIGSSEVADIVIASGVHSAGRTEMAIGIRNAHTLLRRGGSLLLRAPKIDAQINPDYAYAEHMIDMAEQAGFKTEDGQYFNVKTGGEAVEAVDAISALLIKK